MDEVWAVGKLYCARCGKEGECWCQEGRQSSVVVSVCPAELVLGFAIVIIIIIVLSGSWRGRRWSSDCKLIQKMLDKNVSC